VFISLVTATTQPEKVDDAIRVWREKVMPEAKQIPGIKSGRFMVNRTTGTIVSSAAYDTEAEAQSAGTSPQYRQAVSFLTALLTEPVQRVVYEEAVEF
jgi:hypothetical protein